MTSPTSLRKLNPSYLFGLLALLFGTDTQAYDYERAKANLGEEYAQCASYYTFGSIAAKQNGKDDQAEYLKTSSDNSLKMSLTLLPPEVVRADIELAEKTQAETIKKEGFARLILQYADICKAGLENPVERIKYWQDKE